MFAPRLLPPQETRPSRALSSNRTLTIDPTSTREELPHPGTHGGIATAVVLERKRFAIDIGVRSQAQSTPGDSIHNYVKQSEYPSVQTGHATRVATGRPMRARPDSQAKAHVSVTAYMLKPQIAQQTHRMNTWIIHPPTAHRAFIAGSLVDPNHPTLVPPTTPLPLLSCLSPSFVVAWPLPVLSLPPHSVHALPQPCPCPQLYNTSVRVYPTIDGFQVSPKAVCKGHARFRCHHISSM